MHEYPLDFESVLRLPIRVFWLLSNSIQRIQARNDLRLMNVYSASTNGSTDLFNKVREQLMDERGEIIKVKFDPVNEKLDRDGLETLRRLSEKGR